MARRKVVHLQAVRVIQLSSSAEHLPILLSMGSSLDGIVSRKDFFLSFGSKKTDGWMDGWRLLDYAVDKERKMELERIFLLPSFFSLSVFQSFSFSSLPTSTRKMNS